MTLPTYLLTNTKYFDVKKDAKTNYSTVPVRSHDNVPFSL